MKQKIIARAEKRLMDHLRATSTVIEVHPRRGVFNLHCFYNCVEYVERAQRNRKEEPPRYAIAEVIMHHVDIPDRPVLHYLVYDRRNDRYLEVTIGYQARNHNYYFQRWIVPERWNEIYQEFEASTQYWVRRYVGPIARRLLGITRIT